MSHGVRCKLDEEEVKGRWYGVEEGREGWSEENLLTFNTPNMGWQCDEKIIDFSRRMIKYLNTRFPTFVPSVSPSRLRGIVMIYEEKTPHRYFVE